jgi:CRP/FNR family cyclic AMP-dependent transcriptional regulator
MQRGESISQALRRFPLFAGLPDDQLDWFVSQTLHQRYARGEIIFHRGDPGDRAFVILSGSVDLVVESADGRELILARLQAGEHFGEMALLDNSERSATVRASAPSEFVVVLSETLNRALAERPETSRAIIRALAQRLRSADQKLEAFAYLDVEGRIARVLLELAKGGDQIRLSHEELSHMAATSRQTATRVLGEWEEAGFVTLARRGISVNDPGALETLAQL